MSWQRKEVKWFLLHKWFNTFCTPREVPKWKNVPKDAASEERCTRNCVSFCDPHRSKSRCDSSHVNQRSRTWKRNYIPFLCPSVVILLYIGMDKFAPRIPSTLILYEANVNAGALFSNMNAERFPGTQVLNLDWMKNLEADMSSSDMTFLM